MIDDEQENETRRQAFMACEMGFPTDETDEKIHS